MELSLDTDLNNPDTDADGLTDWVEVDYGLVPLNPGDATGDNDLDGLGNADEIIYDSGSWGQGSYGSMSDITLQPGSENATNFIDNYKKNPSSFANSSNRLSLRKGCSRTWARRASTPFSHCLLICPNQTLFHPMCRRSKEIRK